MLILLSQLHDRIKEVLQKCDKLSQKYIQLFGGKGRVGTTEIGIMRKKTGHNRRKAIKRNLKHLFKQCSVLKKELCPNLKVSNDEFSFTSNINGLQDICKNKVENETNNIDIDQVCNIGVKFAKALFVLFEKNVFTHTAKCLILENVTVLKRDTGRCMKAVMNVGDRVIVKMKVREIQMKVKVTEK
ncbi:unnamed protein product [Mytilus coruscus]|uniref:Uncharacterized protein n=1 Tax=Mytilus coruscus TaxID=42192 RepID=A0A6J8A1H3_MYTCO|nr:unnamed protein product [Mytilus coruscus]